MYVDSKRCDRYVVPYLNGLQNLIAPGELDPLNRRLGSQKKPDVVVQVVILAEDASIQEKLKHYDIQVQTVHECAPIEVQPARVLSHLYTYLGCFNMNEPLFLVCSYPVLSLICRSK